MVREKPPPTHNSGEKKKRARSKSVKRGPTLSPFQERLKDSEFYTKPKFDEFLSIPAVKDRLLLINGLLSDDVTDITRAWPLQLKNKDSRLRRELSDLGKDCFVNGQHGDVLHYYNQALMYSSGKGVAHTLARRAAFLLSTGEHKLAVRDLSVALEYGGLESELLDFLLTHHTEDEEKTRANNEASIDNAINAMKNAKLDMQHATTSDISKWADEIRDNLSKAAKLRKNDPANRKIKADILKNIINSIEQASKETNLDENIEIEELEVPKLLEKNPLCPAFSEAAAITFDPEKGRIVKARRAIKAGEMICVDDPTCAMLCPENKENINNHCLNCFRFTKAPLPCDTCCSVVFCSKKCKDQANQSYHKFECQLKLYQLFQFEGRDVFSLFLALRAVTQKPLHYFTENQKEIEKFLDLDEPTFPFPGRAYQSTDYRALCNLMTHVSDIDGDVALKNAVLSVFFLRFIKKSGYFGNTGKLRGDKSLASIETFILRLIHQVICAQTYNSHSVHKITKAFEWERIGTAINPSLALVNHSCDSNSVRCNVNKSSILVAARHIPEGEEITDTYSGHFRDTIKHQREYHTLKHYMFECECAACKENWPLEEDIPYELFRIPTFEQEKIYKVRHGDKKDLVKEVIELRRAVEKSMTYKRFSEALINYQNLCEKLEEHLRRPHIYFLQARSGISHCIWNLYCTQFPELPIEEEDEEDVNALREAANLIYKNNMSEKLVENSGLELGPCEVESTAEVVADDAEKASLLESTRKLLEQSSQKVQGALAETQEQRHRFEQERIKALTTCNGSSSTSDPEKNDSSDLPEQNVLKTQDIMNNKQTIEEREELIKKRQFDQEIIEKEKLMRLEKRKQWDLEDEQRLAREKERKLKREQESKETIKREKEKEELKKKKKRLQEEERSKQKQQEYEKKMEEEKGKRRKQEEERLKRKREEEEELQQLLLEIGDDFDVITTLEEAPSTQNSMENKSESKLNAIEIEQLKVENTPSHNGFSDDIHGNKKSAAGGVKPNTNGVKSEINEVQVFSPDISFKNMIDFSNENDKLIQSNLSPEDNTKPDCEPANVWTSLRKIREGNTDYTTIFSSKTDADAEIVSMTDIDDMIKGLAQQIADKRTTKKLGQDGTNEKLSMIQENEESDEEIVLGKDNQINENSIIYNTDAKKNLKPFDYEIWKSEMEDIYQQPEYPLEKKAEDELYLQNLRQKIQVNVKKVNKENKVKDKEKDIKVEKDNKATPAKKVDDFAMLKLKEKERKKKKQDVKFQQKVLDNEDKLKEMSIKTKKIEKIALDSHVEIQKIREMARKLVAKSEAKENEFNEIFLNLDNLDKISIESEKKNGKKGRKKTENIQSSILTKELHWTEEENNKWTSDKKGVSKVTNVLAALRAAAENGQSKLITDSLKETIYNCKKMEEESQEEKKREKTRQIEEEKERKEEEIKKQKNKENEEKKTMQIEKLKKQKEDEQRILKAVESTEKSKKESELKKLAEEEKLAEEKILAEERIKMEAIEKKKRIEKEKEKRAREKEAELKKQAEVATYKNKNQEKILIEESKKLGASEKKQKLETEKEDEINQQKRSKDLQSIWQEKEKQRVEKEEQKKKLEEEERLKRQEEYIEKMKKEEERKRKETQARLKEEMKMVEEEKARELQLLESRIKREEECRKKEMERKHMAEKKLQAEIEKRKQEEENKLQAERERKEKEYRAIQEERECIEKLLEEKKRKGIEIENESQQNDSNENKSHAFLKQSNGKVSEKFELKKLINASNNKSPEQAETARREMQTEKIKFAEEKKLAQERMKMEAIDKKQRIEKEKEKRARAKEAELNKKAEDAAYNKQNKEKILMEESKKVEAAEKKQKLEIEMKSEEDKLKRLAVTMKQMDQETIKQQIDNKPPPHTQAKNTVPKPVSEKVPDIKESPVIASSHAKDVTDRPSNVVTVSSNSFMPQKNRKSEVQILKIGSPSQIRKAVLCDVKLDEPLEKLNGNENNYQITKIPTTIFEFKKPKPKSEPPKNYSITKVPTENIELEKISKNYVENVVKYSETIPARKRSASVPRPPPPAFKPPPPPPIF